MRNSGFDDDWTAVVRWLGKSFRMFSYLRACVRSLLTECGIAFIDAYPPKPRIPVT